MSFIDVSAFASMPFHFEQAYFLVAQVLLQELQFVDLISNNLVRRKVNAHILSY